MRQDEEQIACVERWARIVERHATVAIDSIQRLMAAILGDHDQVLAPHHIPGAGMGKVEATEDLEPWLIRLWMVIQWRLMIEW